MSGPRLPGHVNDWPNNAGFQAEAEQRKPVNLNIQGEFPLATAGTLLRTGPATYKADNHQLSHWFDGFSQVYKFQITPNNKGTCDVQYSSRRQVDEQLERFRMTGELGEICFGQKRDPCDSFFKKLKAVYSPRNATSPAAANVGITIHPALEASGKGTFQSRTDNAAIKSIDADTLEPIGITDQSKLHPELRGPLSAAHAQFDPKTGDCYNYNLDLGPVATYRIFRSRAGTGRTDILATISGSDIPGAYVHSFFLTANYVVLCLWPARFANLGISILWTRNLLDAIAPFDPKAETRWFVIDRQGGRGCVKRFTSPAMFSFHTVNAFEAPQDDGTVDVLADLITYPDLDVLHKMYYDNLVSNSPGARRREKQTRSAHASYSFSRFRLPNIPLTTPSRRSKSRAEREVLLPRPDVGELPTLNPAYSTKPYRYFYGLADRGLSSFVDGIVKVDVHTQKTLCWSRTKHTPGEAIFVADPARESLEDGGWLLSCVLDGETGTSYLLCLDAETMEEVGRAESEVAWGHGLHGTHVKM